ncbi:hypothetical protein [Thermogymnomonas acidicola]|uniref:hypothetical protein n=1 Tax=Thermogymnomonas acidicola TaxID=399579 RepID=UPI0014950229|nr:hypothetical protein [Thermogymnomonas acidicola]
MEGHGHILLCRRVHSAPLRYARTFPDVRAEHLSAALQLAIALHGNGHVYERLTAHLTKAMRESSLVTSWETPDTGYESRVTGIAREMMEDGGLGGAISEKVRLLANEISLFATACKVICPGVPDFYQGSEVGGTSASLTLTTGGRWTLRPWGGRAGGRERRCHGSRKW